MKLVHNIPESALKMNIPFSKIENEYIFKSYLCSFRKDKKHLPNKFQKNDFISS